MKLHLLFSCILFFAITKNGLASNLILLEIQKSIINDFKLEGKIKIVEEKPNDSTDIPEKELSKGQKAVEEQLRENREKVKQYHEQNEGRSKSDDFLVTKKEENANWRNQKRQDISDWQNEKQAIINQWLLEKSNFNKRIPEYKENLVSEKVFLESGSIGPKKENNTQPKKIASHNTTMPVFADYFVIDKSLDREVKDQGKRPTCAAFTGVRAVEILLSKQGINENLSEQYFFWASIPKCQSSPCKKEGSWVFNAYQSSVDAKSPDIPLLKDCPYSEKPMEDNVTQIPLPDGCKVGYAKIKKFSNVDSTVEIVSAIKNGFPVIGGFKLTENFYKNNGYVFEQAAGQDISKLDDHSLGHAILLVGVMKLPTELRQKEGAFCFVSANSWGTGWGKGGHACISERWFEKHRFNVPFVALEQVKVNL